MEQTHYLATDYGSLFRSRKLKNTVVDLLTFLLIHSIYFLSDSYKQFQG